MFKDEEYSFLSDRVYLIDPKHKNFSSEFKENSSWQMDTKEFKILKLMENSTGLQAVAVASVDNDTEVDLSHIVIAYAGTNSRDLKDLETNVRSIINAYGNRPFATLSEKEFNHLLLSVTGLKTAGQVDAARLFSNEVKKKYPHSTISTTGHSLGGFLALYVAAENQWESVGFNSPDPYDLLSVEAKKWVKENPGMLTNYRNKLDILGNFGGNQTNAEIRIHMGNKWEDLWKAHGLNTWKFDQSGTLIIPEKVDNLEAYHRRQTNQIRVFYAKRQLEIDSLRKKLSTSMGELSHNEKIYLEDTQADLVVQSISKHINHAMDQVISINKKAIYDLEKNWQETLSRARQTAPSLSETELLEILASAGATRVYLVDSPKKIFKQRIGQAKEIVKQFDLLAKEIQTKINHLLQQDHALALQIKR
ncbi:hypothetical protein A5844_000218 [Enterococcus sp. 10A9_DIV0425]|uniref:Fungal lipase-like domain-containing protein n=1 Tax=Candidatus Enterococcus wittei TaxID=1987383 RepID=A0A2C9XP81_9ENTE|nr:lipase [Enterococcus sp. 10A9_DIV0425]OTP12003.1 hypothetical protein A5844_000218 [Enterococcus sp. 10A9_DIV0425]THE10676.1 lipase [Enterococcus hirae]